MAIDETIEDLAALGLYPSGGVTDAALAAKFVVQQNQTTGDLEVNGVPIVITDMVDTWADLQAIPKIAGNDGIAILCKEVGVGIGSVWIYQHSDTKWYPENGQVVMGRFFNVAKVGADTVKEIFAQVYFPTSAGVCCLGVGDTVKLLESYAKTGVISGFSKGWQMGSTGLVGSDTDIDFGVSATATNTNIGGLVVFQRLDDTTVKKMWSQGSNTFNGLSSTAEVTPATATVPSINSNGVYLSTVFNLTSDLDAVVYEYGEFTLCAGV